MHILYVATNVDDAKPTISAAKQPTDTDPEAANSAGGAAAIQTSIPRTRPSYMWSLQFSAW